MDRFCRCQPAVLSGPNCSLNKPVFSGEDAGRYSNETNKSPITGNRDCLETLRTPALCLDPLQAEVRFLNFKTVRIPVSAKPFLHFLVPLVLRVSHCL